MSIFDTIYNAIYPVLFQSASQPELAELSCALVCGFATILLFAIPFWVCWRLVTWIGSGLH